MNKQKMKNKKAKLLMLTKETPEERRKRVSSGIKYRGTVFESKKKKQKYKDDYSEDVE